MANAADLDALNRELDALLAEPSDADAELDRLLSLDDRDLKREQLRYQQSQVANEIDFSKIFTRAGLGISEGSARLKEAGATILANPLGGFTPKAAKKGVIAGRLRETADEARRSADETAKLGEEVGGGPVGAATQALAATAVSSAPTIPAAMIGGLPLAAGTAGVQQFGSTLADATRAYMDREGLSREDAERKARLPALVAGAITSTLTRIIPGGAERIAQSLATGELTKQSATSLVRNILKEAALEFPEESLDQLANGIVAKVSYDPDKTGEQIWTEAVYAGLAGSALAGITGGAGAVIGRTAQGAERLAQDVRDRRAIAREESELDAAAIDRELVDAISRMPADGISIPAPESPTRPGLLIRSRTGRRPYAPTEIPQQESVPVEREGTDAQLPAQRQDRVIPTEVPTGSTPTSVGDSVPAATPVISPPTAPAPGPESEVNQARVPQEEKKEGQLPVTPAEPAAAGSSSLPAAAGPPTLVFGDPSARIANIAERITRSGLQVPQLRTASKLESLAVYRPIAGKIYLLNTLDASIDSGSITEDEIAFIIAHETIHQRKGHQPNSPDERQFEKDANLQAAAAIANAGFNPLAGASILRKAKALKEAGVQQGIITSPSSDAAHNYDEDAAEIEHKYQIAARKSLHGRDYGKQTSSQLLQLLNSNQATVASVLQQISIENREYAELARELLATANPAGLTVPVGRSAGTISYYAPKADRVFIGGGEREIPDGLIIHEIIHALTVKQIPEWAKTVPAGFGRWYIQNLRDQLSSDATSEPIKNLINTYLSAIGAARIPIDLIGNPQALSDKASNFPAYGLGNLYEFISETFSNKQFQKWLDSIPSQTPGKSLWQKFVDAIYRLLNLVRSSPTLLSDAIQAGADIISQQRLTQGGTETGQFNAPLNEATSRFPQIQAESPARAQRAVELGQAGEVIAQRPTVQSAVKQLEATANSTPSNPKETFERDVAERVLNNPFVRDHLADPARRLIESSKLVGDTVTSLRQIESDPNSTEAEKQAAAKNAFDVIDAYLQAKAAFDSSYDSNRTGLQNAVKQSYVDESEAMANRDRIQRLMDDFKTLGRRALRTGQDDAAWRAYRNSLRLSSGLQKAIDWIVKNVDLSTVRSRGITDLEGMLNLFENTARPSYTPDRNRLEQIVGANDETIRTVAKIMLMSEPLQARMLEGQKLAEQTGAAAPTNEIKTELGQEIKKGNYDAALQLFTRGIGDTEVKRQAARDAANFFQRQTRRHLVALSALDEVKRLSTMLDEDATLRQQIKEVYDRLNIAEVMQSNNGTTIRFKQVDDAAEPVEVNLGNNVRDWQENFTALRNLWLSYKEYLESPNANPQKANGIRNALPVLEFLLDPLNDARNPHLIHGEVRRAREALLEFGLLRPLGLRTKFSTPVYSMTGMTGPAASYYRAAERAAATAMEMTRAKLTKHWAKRTSAAIAAAKAHGLTPAQYRREVWRPLVSTRQNFNDPTILNLGDSIGNGRKIKREDLEYMRVWEAFEHDLIETVNNFGKTQFGSMKLLPQGIVMDKGRRTRFPVATGPNTISRAQPDELPDWLAKWQRGEWESLLNDEASRFILGYIRGIRQADWRFQYAFPEETAEVLRTLGEEPVTSFDDLAQRIFDIRADDAEAKPMNLDEVRDELRKDFARIFEGIRRATQRTEGDVKTDISATEIIGGESPFITERSRIYMPPGWYDYGGITDAEATILAKRAELPFFLALKHSLETLRGSLQAITTDFERQLENAPNTGKESDRLMRRGRVYYSQGEAIRALNAVNSELANLNDALNAKSDVPVAERPYEIKNQGIIGYMTGGLLATPTSMAKNRIGASINSALSDVYLGRSGATGALVRESGKRVAGAMKELLYLLSHEGNPAGRALYKLLQNSKNKAIVGRIAESLVDFINSQRTLYGETTKDLGLNLSYPLSDQLKAILESAEMGGNVAERPPETIVGKVRAAGSAGFKGLARATSQMGVMFADSRANAAAVGDANAIEQHLKNVAQRYGPAVEEAAAKEGRDPWDWTDPRNRFPDQALADSKTNAAAIAQRQREWWRDRVSLQLDRVLLEYYRRWKDSDQNPETPLYSTNPEENEEWHNQLVLAHAEDVNLPTHASRPTWPRSSAFAATLYKFGQYPVWQMQKLEGLFDRLSNESWLKSRIKSIPLLTQVALLLVVGSVLGMEMGALLRRLLNKESAFPTPSDAGTSKELAISTISALADQIPFYGSAINMALNRGYNTGYDLNNMFVDLNMLSDMLKTSRKIYETGNAARPLEQFATRWVFPLNVVGQFLPNQIGLREMTNTRNILASGARSTGMEGLLRKPQSGGGSDMRYTPASPILDEAVNAIGRDDFAGFQKAFDRLVNYRRDQRDEKPEQSAFRAIQGRDPRRAIFMRKPEDEEMQRIYGNLPAFRRQRAQGNLERFDSYLERVRPAPIARTRRRTGLRRVGMRTRRLRRSVGIRSRRPRLSRRRERRLSFA